MKLSNTTIPIYHELVCSVSHSNACFYLLVSLVFSFPEGMRLPVRRKKSHLYMCMEQQLEIESIFIICFLLNGCGLVISETDKQFLFIVTEHILNYRNLGQNRPSGPLSPSPCSIHPWNSQKRHSKPSHTTTRKHCNTPYVKAREAKVLLTFWHSGWLIYAQKIPGIPPYSTEEVKNLHSPSDLWKKIHKRKERFIYSFIHSVYKSFPTMAQGSLQ